METKTNILPDTTGKSGDVIMIRALFIDEIPALRQHAIRLTTEVLSGHDRIYAIEACNALEAVEHLKSHDQLFVVVDIFLPDMNGLKLAKLLWDQCETTRILFWSRFHRDYYLQELTRMAPEIATYGYILKTESDEKLRYAIECLFVHNNPYIDPMVRIGAARRKSPQMVLTDSELQMLHDLTLGLTDKAIGKRRGLSVRGVQNRMASLSNKLLGKSHCYLQESTGLSVYNPRARMILEALKQGLLDTAEIPELDDHLQTWFQHNMLPNTQTMFQP